jgi:hypothetical protein
MIKNNIPTEKKEKVHVNTLNGTFFHEKTNSGFVQLNRIEGNSVQNGTPTPDKPIEVKSFDSEIVTSGKNLIDMEYLMNYFNNKLGQTVISKESDGSYKFALPTGFHDLPITFDKSKRYAMRCKYKQPRPSGKWGSDFFFLYEDGSNNGFQIYDIQEFEDKDIISKEGKVISRMVINSPNGTSYPSWYKDFQLEVLEDGQEAPSEYEPFHATKTEKLTLRSLPNGFKDTLERQSDGSYLLTQNLMPFEFNGSDNEEWELSGSDYTTYNIFGLTLNDIVTGKRNGAISNRFKIWSGIGDSFPINSVFTEQGYQTRIMFSISNTDVPDVNAWKTWLKSNPISGHYELATPIQRKVWLSPLSAYEGQTNIFANSEVGAEMEVEILTTNAVNGKLQELKENILQERPNPNLLVNSDFRNPINTTGKKEWGGNGSTLALDGMRILDGWVSRNKMTKTLLINGCLRIQNGSGEATGGRGINQILDKQTIKGRKMTLSLMVKNISNTKYRISLRGNEENIYSNSKIITSPSDIMIEKAGLYTFTFDVFDELPYPYIVFGLYTDHKMHENPLGSYIDIEWVKLEIGDKATPLEYEDSKLNQLKTDGVPLLYGGEEIIANADLNNYVNIGNYYCQSNDIAHSLKNKPNDLTNAFTMEVKMANGIVAENSNYHYFLQKIEDMDGKVFKRTVSFIEGNYMFGEWSSSSNQKFLNNSISNRLYFANTNSDHSHSVNLTKGIYYIDWGMAMIKGINGKVGTYFKTVNSSSVVATPYLNSFDTTSNARNGAGLLIFTGKKLFLIGDDATYRSIKMTEFTENVENMTSITIAGNPNTHLGLSIFKIADYL